MINAVKKARERHRKAIEMFYEDACTVYEMQPVKDEKTKKTSQKEVAVLKEQPCKLSFENITTTSKDVGAAEKKIATKLFISPEVVIKPGSKVVVTHEGTQTAFCNSGMPAVFSTHQEIDLSLFERWA